MKIAICTAFALVVAAMCWVHAQDRHGTLAVVRFRPGRITIAVDSRTNLRSGGSTTIRDDECKVTTLGKYAVFVASGFTGYESNGPTDRLPAWRAVEEARRVYAGLMDRERSWRDSRLDELALIWADTIKSHFSDLARYNPDVVRQSAVDGLLTSAVLATGQGSTLKAVAVQIAVDPAGVVSVRPLQAITSEVCPPCALGRGEIVTEFLGLKTERSQAEWRRFTAETVAMTPDERERRLAIRLVDLTIRFLPDAGNVGGPIDALELDAGKGVRWIQRKPNCPE